MMMDPLRTVQDQRSTAFPWRNLALLGCLCLAVLGCKRPPAEEIMPPLPDIPLHLGVTFKHNAHPYELGTIYADAGGHEYRLDTLRFVISAPRAMDHDEVVVEEYPNTCLLVDAAVPNEFLLGVINHQHLHEIRFTTGLEPALNHADPATTPALNTVAPMHGGSQVDGHYFLILAGQVDGNGDGIIDADDPTFSFKCMGDGLQRTGIAPAHADLPDSGPLTSWVLVDMARLMADIDLLNTPSSTGHEPIHVQLMDQLAEAMEQHH